ncbi:uncharacterized protein F4812DRAFT_407921 [Daldinia caldariorum]|uniref:uncharacterized protein n=1 Tax=Daldinia caldariorum TaxID=326644 RepID=UPI00200878D7|nr:uncharacterized protein F4812DRAFT_407921 [Daldinia caldariorum]KAI1472232.1 hypothetical protein F4812DRAFT_407921 [Daldinia caldariorum]
MSNSVSNRYFAGKLERIQEQYEEFQSKPEAQKDVEAYLNQTEDHQYAEYEKWIKQKTVFTDYNHAPAVLVEGENVLLIGNHNSFNTVQYPEDPAKAGMSMVHILGIPKKPLFNGVSLNHETVSVIDEVVSLFKECWEFPDFRDRVSDHQREAIESRTATGLSAKQKAGLDNQPVLEAGNKAIFNWEELAEQIDSLDFDDFTFGLHLWPDHSIGHLHVHIVATPDWCRRYSTLKHDEKTKDALEVRDFILSRDRP